MSETLTIALRLENKAPTQYTNFPFNSIVEFGGTPIVFGDTGIFTLEGATDNGTEIDAYFDLPLHDFSTRRQKLMAAVDVGFETSDDLTVTITPDEKSAYSRAVTISPPLSGQVQQDGYRTLPKVANGRGRYWGVRVANTNGCDFSVDYLALAPVFLKRYRGE